MNIVVIDDDKLVALSLKTILESTQQITVAAIGSGGEEALPLYRKHSPDVLLMDIRMGGMDGIEAGQQLLREFPDARILYLTTFADDEYIIKALGMGAKGYILKQDFESIAPALEAVMRGQSVFGEKIVTKLPELMKQREEYDFEAHGINAKEREIMELVARGLSNKEIAGELFLGEGTVRNYLSTLLEKLALRDRTQLAVYYYTEVRKA
ncbi:MAG: response regulator transcription factor [Ruminococcus sp.]|nr:response regulator transcription factor [Ruminococcus sp.]